MALLIKLIQWLVSGLAGFITLSGLIRLFFTGDLVFPLMGLISLLLVFPPIQPVLEKRLPLLRPRAIKIGLSVILLLTSLVVVSSTAPSLQNVKLCTTLTAGECSQDTLLIVKNTPKLYLSATSNHLRQGTKVQLDLTYSSEPGKTKTISSTDVAVKIDKGIAQFELAPKTLPVGRYEASLFSEDKAFFKINKPFTIWNSQQEIDQRLAKKLKTAPTKLTKVRLCQSSDEQECQADNSSYKGKITSLTMSAEVDNAVDGVEVTYTWRLLSLLPNRERELIKRTRSLKGNVGYLSYSLRNEQGFEPGTYEVIVNLETTNSVPIRKEFTIK